MIIANLFLAIHVIIIMFCKNVWFLILAQFIDAIGFSIKDTAETSLLSASIPDSDKKGAIFSELEGKGLKNYHYFSAITAIITGFLYEINPYIPLLISMIIAILSSVICLGFEEIREENEKDNNESENEIITSKFKELIISFKFIIKSSRLKALLLYSAIFWALVCLMSTYITSLLKDMGATAILISLFTFLKDVSAGIGSKRQRKHHEKYRNKGLSVILYTITTCMWIIGIVGILNIYMNLKFEISVSIIGIATVITFIAKGVHVVLSSRYLQNFTNEQILPQIYSANSLTKNLCRVIIGVFGSYFLRVTNTANAIIICAIMSTIITIALVSYMKTRIGLKPEEYEKEEIEFKI